MDKPPAKFAISLRDAIWIGALLVSIGIQWAQNSATKDDLATFKLRYEREVVPRGEQVQMNKVLEERLGGIQDKLLDIKAQLVDIKLKQK